MPKMPMAKMSRGKAKGAGKRGGGKKGSKSRGIVERMMKEVHTDEPSTVTRAKHFGPGGKETMLRAVAMNKARQAGAHVRRFKSA